MKSLLLSILSLLILSQSFAQADSGMIARGELKKGFYKTYQEYLDNAPSIVTGFDTELFRAGKKDPTIIAGSYKIKDASVKPGKIWGFSDGQHVFVRYKVLLGHGFWKLQCPGPNPYILYKSKFIWIAGPPMMALATTALTAAVPAGYDLMVVTKSGKIKYGYKGQIKKILADAPELLEPFKKIKVLHDNHRAKYLRLYGESKA
jgi:hypothetical protein